MHGCWRASKGDKDERITPQYPVASLKYRNEEELLAQVDDPVKYNDEVIWPDKVRLNKYYCYHYSFLKDIEMIFATVLGRKVKFAGEEI